jgi:LTXXQ motif family protein
MLALKRKEELIMRYVLTSLTALAICSFGVAATAAPGQMSEPAGMERMQLSAADHEALLTAKLAGVKAGLKLTPDQEKLWAPFEAAVRDAAKLRMDQMKAMMDRMRKMREMMDQTQNSSDIQNMGPTGAATSPVDRLEAAAKRVSERGAAMLNVAEAAKPLYATFDDSQKRLFGLLGGDMLMMGRVGNMQMTGGMGKGMMGGMGMMGRDGMGAGMMGQGGMGMTGREPGGMNMTGKPSNEDEDNSDEE